MGFKNKSFLKVQDKTFIELLLDQLRILGHEIIINVKNMLFYTTGRLTSEMVIKCIKMQIPILLSRSGFTAWAVEIARKKKLTMIGRLRGKRLNVLSGDFRFKK